MKNIFFIYQEIKQKKASEKNVINILDIIRDVMNIIGIYQGIYVTIVNDFCVSFDINTNLRYFKDRKHEITLKNVLQQIYRFL